LLRILNSLLDLVVGFLQCLNFWVMLQLVVNELALNVDSGDTVFDKEYVF
jgi:hypothetical protein